MEVTEEKLKDILEEQRKEYQNHLGTIAENFESQTKLIAESLSGIQQQLVAIKEMVAENTEGIQEMKVNMEIMKSDIEIIKQNLRRKVDLEDFETLEKRVMFLEKKLATR